ncbi:MAG: glycosyltransferase [Phycisphaerae bacterium]|nr:glycosyltransferase [Phycisphaerae bacterium]
MKILITHNFYQQPGGEDEVFYSEESLLRSFGHEPITFKLHNDDVRGMGRTDLIQATVWNRRTHHRMRELVREHRPDVVHFHNTFPLASPGVYYAARAEGAAVVQTLHNYRLMCPGAALFRDSKPCEECIGKTVPWNGIVHKCYRHSTIASAVVAATLTVHRFVGTWQDAVDVYITPSEFTRQKYIQAGFPQHRLVVKANFVHPDPGIGPNIDGGTYAAFVGRLSPEKGLDTLLAAWNRPDMNIPLRIVGDGPLAEDVRRAVAINSNIQWLGRMPSKDVYEFIGGARLLVVPSNCYETFGRVAIEAFAKGVPVVGADHGAVSGIVDPGRTGELFTGGDPVDLARKVQRLFNRNDLPMMRQRCRQEFTDKYTGEQNHEELMEIYQRAIADARHRQFNSAGENETTGFAYN